MSSIEHLIENAINCVENEKKFEEFMQDEKNRAMIKTIKATPEEIWEIAQYIVYTHDEFRDE